MADLLLEIVEGPGLATEIPLAGAVELGRDPALALALDDNQVSRRHARVTTTADGAQVEDLGSSNGTYVNDQPIQGAHRLAPGDRLRVGLTVLELRSRDDVTVQGSAVAPRPQVTRIGDEVLQPAGPAELAPVRADQADVPSLMAEESEPAFIQASAVHHGVQGGDAAAARAPGARTPDDIARLVDGRVKSQTRVAAFAFLAIAALAVAILLGVG